MRVILFVVLSFLGSQLYAQNFKVDFKLLITDAVWNVEDNISYDDGISYKLELVKFYTGNFRMYQQGKEVWNETGVYHLINSEKPASYSIQFPGTEKLQFDSISFCIGTDSLANVSGARSGDLDPLKGMYWTWNSGYINVKIEGTSPACKAFNNAFEYHMGGYLKPYETIQNIGFRVSSKELEIGVQLGEFMGKIDLTQQGTMIPGEDAVRLSKQFASCFRIK